MFFYQFKRLVLRVCVHCRFAWSDRETYKIRITNWYT